MIRAISANPKPNFFSQGALDQTSGSWNEPDCGHKRNSHGACRQPARTSGRNADHSKQQQYRFHSWNVDRGHFCGRLESIRARRLYHVVDINAAHTLQGAAAAGAAGDAPTQPGAENTAGGTAEANALGVMGELRSGGPKLPT